MTTASLLDTDALTRLGEHLGEPALLCAFLGRFEAALDRRIARLHRALVAQDHEDWMDAVLSLKTSSAMAGATALAQFAAALQDQFGARASEQASWPDADRLEETMSTLGHLAAGTARQLLRFAEQVSG